MCDKCRARAKARGAQSQADALRTVQQWFDGLTKTNRVAAIEMMLEVQISVAIGMPVGNGIERHSTELEIATAVMDSYLSAVEREPRLAHRRIDELESASYNAPKLSDFVVTLH